jgi:hypothetical protein
MRALQNGPVITGNSSSKNEGQNATNGDDSTQYPWQNDTRRLPDKSGDTWKK